jgi:hypothetical protein
MNPKLSGWRFPLRYAIKRKNDLYLTGEYYLDGFGSPV